MTRQRQPQVEAMDEAESERLSAEVAGWVAAEIAGNFDIDDREGLGHAIDRAREAYYDYDQPYGSNEPRDAKALAGLGKPLQIVVKSLETLHFWLADEITARSPGDDWQSRCSTVEAQIDDLVVRLTAVGDVIHDERQRRIPPGSVAAVVGVLLGYWRGVLGRAVKFDHNGWKKGYPPPRDRKRAKGVADRADLFLYDIMVNIAGEDAADEVREALKRQTDKKPRRHSP